MGHPMLSPGRPMYNNVYRGVCARRSERGRGSRRNMLSSHRNKQSNRVGHESRESSLADQCTTTYTGAANVMRPGSDAQRCEGREKRPPDNRMRWPAVGPRSATSGCVRARTRAHATGVRHHSVGLRTIK